MTYSHLQQQIEKTASTFCRLGMGANDRIAIVMPNGPEMAVAFLAIASVASAAPLNPGYRSKEFDFYLADLDAKSLLIMGGLDSQARKVAQNRKIPIIELTTDDRAEAGRFELTGDTGLAPIEQGGYPSSTDIALVLHTSGTTSRPKIVPLSHANVCTSARNIVASLALTHTDRCLGVMPLFHIHGLVAALLSSLAAGGSVICSPGFDPSLFLEWVSEKRPTWYTAVPTMHQSLLAEAQSLHDLSHSLRFIRSCSSALPPQVMNDLEDTFAVPVVEAYGMTEAAHQMACNPLPPRERKIGSVGLRTGTDIAIMNELGILQPPHTRGEIVIRGENVLAGYENNPEANASAFAKGWFRTGDEGYLDDEGYLFITDRLKEIINRGGEKISPREVDEVLMDHPSVAQVVTFAMPHPQLGEEVAAAVKLRDGCSTTTGELQVHTSKQLADFKVPKRVLIVEEIPKGPTGKLKRVGLADTLGVSVASGHTADDGKPCSAIEQTLIGHWTRAMGLTGIGVHDNFFEMGGHSLQLVQILSKVREQFQVELSPQQIFETPTISGVAKYLEGKDRVGRASLQQEFGSSLVPLRAGSGKQPFFLVPGGGGGLSELLLYARLIQLLEPEQAVYGLVAAGQNGKASAPPDVETMISDYISEIRSFQPEGPYLLGGECIGGKVAFEIARQLRLQGHRVPLLVLMNTILTEPGSGPLRDLERRAINVQQTALHHLQQLRAIRLIQWPAYFSSRLSNLQRRILPLSSRQRADRSVSRARSDYHRLLTGYRPRQPYPDRLTLVVSAEDYVEDTYVAWKGLAEGGIVLEKVPGNRFSYLNEHADTTAGLLRSCLKNVRMDTE